VAENHAEKEAELLAYCGGTEFRQRIEGMLEAVKGMMDDTEREHQAMVSMLARRRKQQEQVARAIAGLYGDVSAIIGTLPRIQRLELPPGDRGGGQAA
jgi:hypothetical protein